MTLHRETSIKSVSQYAPKAINTIQTREELWPCKHWSHRFCQIAEGLEYIYGVKYI